jgi:Membrane-bound metallopeptidase
MKKWNFLNSEDCLLWINYAKQILKRSLRANPRDHVTSEGKRVKLKKLDDVYEHVCEVNPSVGKNWGRRTPPSITDIHKIQKAFPDLQKQVQELHEMNNASTSDLRKKRDDLVRELRAELDKLRARNEKLEEETKRQKEIIRILNDIDVDDNN